MPSLQPFNDLSDLLHQEREIYGIKDIINCMINNDLILRREVAEMRLESSVTEAWLNIVECPRNRSDCLVIRKGQLDWWSVRLCMFE